VSIFSNLFFPFLSGQYSTAARFECIAGCSQLTDEQRTMNKIDSLRQVNRVFSLGASASAIVMLSEAKHLGCE
jgi:hypothetical protein